MRRRLAAAPPRCFAQPCSAVLLAAVLLAALACAGAQPSTPGDPDAPPDLELPRDVRPLAYALELSVDPAADRYRGTVAIELELGREQAVLWLHARDLDLSEGTVEVGGARWPVTSTRASEAGAVRLRAEHPFPRGRAVVRLAFEGAARDRLGEGGLVRLGGTGATHALLTSGPAGARALFPCLDDPSLRAPITLSLEVPEGDGAAWMAPLAADEVVVPGRRRLRFDPTPPWPTHLLLGAVGPLVRASSAPLPVAGPRAFALPLLVEAPRRLEGSLRRPLEAVRVLLPALEELTGSRYPVRWLGVAALPGLPGVMGSPGLLLLPAQEGAAPSPPLSDADADGLALALAAAWFGGEAGAVRWRDAWAEVGLARVAAGAALRTWRPLGAAEREVEAADAALAAQLLPGARALRPAVNRPADLVHLRGPSVSSRAGALLAAWARALGPGRFREALRGWLARPGTARTGEDLGAVVTQAAGRALGPPLRALADAAGVVRLEARVACEGTGPRLELTVGRARLPGSSWAPPAPTGGLPVCARYEAAGALGEACTVLEEARGVLALPACPRWVMPVAGGLAPWRWLLAPADRTRLRDAGFLHLSPAERLSWALDLRAAARAGELPMSEALASLSPLARDGDARVAAVAPPLLAEVVEDLLPPRLLAGARVRVAELYRPRLRELSLDPGPGEREERLALRRTVAELLVAVARDPESIRLLAARGRAWAGLPDGPRRPAAVAPELLPVALAATVDEGGAAAFDALEARLLSSTDPGERGAVAGALGTARDPALSARALALASDARLAPAERAALVRGQVLRRETRDAGWRTLQRRWDLVAPALLGPDAEELPGLAAGLCDRERVPALRAFLERRTDRLPALARRTSQATAAVEACAALREAQGASAAAWFAGG